MKRRQFIRRLLGAALAAPFARLAAPVVQIMRWNRRDEVTLSPLNCIALKDSIRLTERVCRTLARNNPYLDILGSKAFPGGMSECKRSVKKVSSNIFTTPAESSSLEDVR